MKLQVLDINGKETGEEVELPQTVFDVEPNDNVIALAVQTELTRRRQGTHATRNRAMIRGGGKKPWRQKGRGVARAGTIRSPLWRGGGTIFGPQPHPYVMKLNKKVSRLARKSALTYKARDNNIKAVMDFNWEDGKTSNARKMMKALATQKGKVLLLTNEYYPGVYRACKNIPDLDVIKAVDASTYQIMKSGIVLIQKSAINNIQEALDK